MKKIKLIFYGLGYNNFNQAFISIYDSNNNLVSNGYTYNNEMMVCLKECAVYRMVALSNGKKLVTSFYVNNNCTYRFSFESSNEPDNSITFILTDSFYENLPIERGELLLWQNQ